MNILIIGGGEAGLALANQLTEEHKVTIIEKDEALSKEIAEKTSALVIQGDGSDVTVLKDAGLEDADAIVAVSGDDKVNLMVCEIAKNNKVEIIISLVNSSNNQDLFRKLKITSVISSVAAKVAAIKRSLKKEENGSNNSDNKNKKK